MVAAQCLEEDQEDNIANFLSTWCLCVSTYVLNTQYPEKKASIIYYERVVASILAQLAN